MKQFVFRNYTVEPLFDKETQFSGYGNTTGFNPEAESYVWFYLCPLKEDPSLLAEEINSYLLQLNLVMSWLGQGQLLILTTLAPLMPFRWENGNTLVDLAIQRYNETLYEIAGKYKGAYVVKIEEYIAQQHTLPLIDWKFYYLSQMLLNPALAKSFKEWFAGKLRAIEGKRKKCMILDLDNTLWGGILGEDGIQGIQLGNAYPGNVYLEFQKYLLQASKTGVILAVVSKNNENDVLEAWEKHPAMVLKQEHLSACRINWIHKAENISSLVKELNIGMDSCVFIDDNPVERALVASMIPELTVPDFPEKIYEILPIFQKIYQQYFQIYKLTEEDRQKTLQYKENAMRRQLQGSTSSMEDYLSALETEVTLADADAYTIGRLAQLTQKTNQFNLTTKRYTEADLTGFLQQGSRILSLSVKDRFGDSGITGLVIAHLNGKNAVIDTCLLSCRILGRNIEKVFLKEILNLLFREGITKVQACYIATARNSQVAHFYDDLGFEVLNRSNEGSEYSMNLTEELELEKYIKVNRNVGKN